MQTTKWVAAALFGVATALAAPFASAQQFYLGGSVGSSDADDGNAIPDLITSGTVDGSDSGTKLFGGYGFTRNFAVELAYVDLGKLGYSGMFGPLTVTNGSVKTSGFAVSAVGLLPLNQSVSLFGKAGVYSWEAKARDITAGAPFAAKEDGSDLFVGLGAAFDVTRNFSVRAEWEFYEAVDRISLLSVGIAVKF